MARPDAPEGPPHDGISWYRLSADAVLEQLHVDAHQGLSPREAHARLNRVGPNAIREGRRRGALRMLADQFTDFMILVLIAAAIVSGLIGDLTDTIVILVIVILNAIIGFVQEFRAERAVAALKALAAPNARVVRGGSPMTISAMQLVPGDVVLLEAGNVVPADLRLINVHALKADESALTGESDAVEKHARLLHGDVALGDRLNTAFKGTLVTYGRGRGVVVATGMDTELGRIARLLREVEEVKTPLQKRLARFGARLAVAVLVICVVVFVAGALRGESILLMLLTAISLAVAAIPEALPAVVTVSLALGAVTMVRKQALIRRLPAVETLGSVTYICSDKTGTLTQNRMHAESFYADGRMAEEAPAGPPWSALMTILALSNDATRDEDGQARGDPTEVALFEAAERAGFRKSELAETLPRISELPFDSERKRMTTLHRAASPLAFAHILHAGARSGHNEVAEHVALTKGAPEALLPHCRTALAARGIVALDRAAVAEVAEQMAAAGLRVLAVAARAWPELPHTHTPKTIERDLIFVGLVGLLDPPRKEAAQSVTLCKGAGITPVMITGDHPATAANIARRVGILDDGDAVITGHELARLAPDEFARRVKAFRVYARVAPEQKIRIVQALQEQGEFVAMTGDGVNDAPALRRADIGIAMGITGTDVAKEAAHMTLLDDNFRTIVSAVREGRRIFDNIRKFIKYTMTSNSGEILVIFLAPFAGLPIPLLPIHILWINLVTDGLPGLALAAEPEERGLMQRPPRPPQESIFAHGLWQHIVWVGLLMAGVSLLIQALAIHNRVAHWQTMVFTVLTLSQMGHVLAIRSERDSIFRQGLGSNLPLVGAVLLTFVLQMGTIYIPWLNPIFKTEALSLAELALCLAASTIVFVAVEIEKRVVRRGRLSAAAGRD